MKRPFKKHKDNAIIFENGTIFEFKGDVDTSINGKLVTVQQFIEYLLSDQYLIDNGYDK